MLREHDPIDTASEQEAKEQQAAIDQLIAFYEASDFKEIMSTETGRRFIYGQIARGGLFQDPYDGTDQGTAHNAGAANEARYLMGMIMDHCPEKFVLMISEKEEHARRITEQQR